MEPCLCLNQSGGRLPRKSGVNAQNTVGVSIKNIVSPNIIFQLLCSFGNLTEVVTYVKGL